MARKPKKPKSVETFVHDEATRRNILTAEYHPVMTDEDEVLIRVAHERRIAIKVINHLGDEAMKVFRV